MGISVHLCVLFFFFWGERGGLFVRGGVLTGVQNARI